MTLDETIKHVTEVAYKNYTQNIEHPNDKYAEKRCKCANEHQQLACWLSELKEHKNKLADGYTLCRVDEAVKKLEELFNSTDNRDFRLAFHRAIKIIREACE